MKCYKCGNSIEAGKLMNHLTQKKDCLDKTGQPHQRKRVIT